MIHPRPFALALLLLAPFATAGVASAKGKPAAGPPATATPGISQLDAKPHFPYIWMGVPKDYAATNTYPLFYVLPPCSDNAELSKPDQYAKAWSESLLKRGWIVASPAIAIYDNEESLAPLTAGLKKVLATYHIDERRIVIGGYGAGASMGWRMVVKFPELWAGMLAVSGEVLQLDRGNLKVFAGKPALVFHGTNDPNYTATMLANDKTNIEFAKIKLTIEELKGWKFDFPGASVEPMSKWLDNVYPGSYHEKAVAIEKAVAEKSVLVGYALMAELRAELKKSPYPAFENRVTALDKALNDAFHAPFEEAKKLLETNPLAAVEQAEAAAKALKGNPALEKEGAAIVAALKKEPKVIEATKARDAEAAARKLLPKAEEAEGKGDFAAALALFKKIVALGETSIKADCEAKVAELEKKVR